MKIFLTVLIILTSYFAVKLGPKSPILFESQHYECINVPRTVHGPVKSKRGHGGVCLFIRENIS